MPPLLATILKNCHFEPKIDTFQPKIGYFQAKIGHLEPKTDNFEAKTGHFEAKIRYFQAKIGIFEAKIGHCELKTGNFEPFHGPTSALWATKNSKFRIWRRPLLNPRFFKKEKRASGSPCKFQISKNI